MTLNLVPGDIEGLPIARAAIVGNLIICTIVPDDETGQILDGTALVQSRLVFANLSRLLEDCGSSLARVAHVTIYLPDLADRDSMTVAWREAFGDQPPARATIGVAALAHLDMKIEITAIAHV